MTEGHPSRLDIERLSAGEVSTSERSRLEAHLEECSTCQSYFDELESDRAALLALTPPAVFVAQVTEREGIERTRLRRRFLWWSGGGLAMAAAAAAIAAFVLFHPDVEDPPSGTPDDEYRLMGSTTVRAFLNRAGAVSTYELGQPLAIDDQLRIEVTVTEPSHVVLLAVENRGIEPVTLVPGAAHAVVIDGQTILPGSIVITEDPEPVRLILVVRDEPFRVIDIEQEVRTARRGRPVDSWTAEEVDGVAWTIMVAPELP